MVSSDMVVTFPLSFMAKLSQPMAMNGDVTNQHGNTPVIELSEVDDGKVGPTLLF